MKTYWLATSDDNKSSTNSSQVSSLDSDNLKSILDDKLKRLVAWNAEMLVRSLKQIAARRNKRSGALEVVDWKGLRKPNIPVVEEIKEVITFPNFVSLVKPGQKSATIDGHVEQLVYDYVEAIAIRYKNNTFHNFEHASHVTMVSTIILLINVELFID